MLNKFFDWIARAYYWVYCRFLQRPPDEPFTRQADRFERRWPYLAYGIALIIFFITARYLDSWWLVLTAVVYLFFLWFMPHINSYQRAHLDNEPYMVKTNVFDKAATWAADRIAFNDMIRRQKCNRNIV